MSPGPAARSGRVLPRYSAALACTCLALSGCGDDGTGVPDDITGTYLLQSVNGAPLPAAIATGWVVEWGMLRLQQGGTCTSWQRHAGISQPLYARESCTWTRDGGQLSVQFDAASRHGEISGSVLTLENGAGDEMAYQRGVEDVSGVYTLVTIDGNPLPAINRTDWLWEWGEIVLESDGGARWRNRYRGPNDPLPTESSYVGTHTLDGADLTLEIAQLGFIPTGVVGGNVLRLSYTGTLVYRREE